LSVVPHTGRRVALQRVDAGRTSDQVVRTTVNRVAPSSPDQTFAISVRELNDDQVCVAVSGELDLSTANELKELLGRELADRRTVVLDLANVGFIDSTGLAAIVSGLHRSHEFNSELQLCSELQPQARRLMELTGVLALIPADGRRSTDSAVSP
jgi:anti-sigma B factor antagonist